MRLSRCVAWLLSCTCGITVVSGVALAQDTTQARDSTLATDSTHAAIRGTVRDSLGFPVAGASLMLTPGNRLAHVDSSGRFAARELPPGLYRVRVRSVGFAPLDTAIVARAGAVADLTLVMERLPVVLDTVVVKARALCPRFSLEGVLCRRGTTAGILLTHEDILAKKPLFIADVLRDVDGFRVTVGKEGRDVIPTKGWRCTVVLVNGNARSLSNPLPRVRDLYAVEVYQPEDMPPEYQHWYWRGAYPCTLVVIWTTYAKRR